MPRPKRTKVASTTARVVKPSQVAKPAPAPTKSAKKPRVIENFSEDSDGLITKRTHPRIRKPWEPTPESDVDLTMTGALPVDDNEDNGKTHSKRRSPMVLVSSGGHRTPTSAASNKGKRSGRGKQPASDRPTPADSHNRASFGESEQADDSLSLDNLLSFDSLDSDSPAHGTRPPSAMKVGGTPGHETSILALTNFRRRPRQPSLLRMVHQTTDVEDNDLDDLDDFNPAAESTPLHVRKSGLGNEGRNDSGLSLSSTSSRGKKRKLSPPASPVIQVPRSSPLYDPPSGADVEGSHRSSSPSLPEEIVQSTEDAQEQTEQPNLDLYSETMAPPRSSSPPAEEVDEPTETERPRRRRARATRRAADNDTGSEDGEEAAVTKPKTRRKANEARISTAKLQALLPRRRTHFSLDRDVYAIRSSDDGSAPVESDEDELQMPAQRLASKTRKSAPAKSKKLPRKAKGASIALEPVKKPTRTYGRTSSDKENESSLAFDDEDDEDTFEVPSPKKAFAKAPNLEAINKKFAEVDEWEMEFEDVDEAGQSSSPWR